MRKFHTNVPSFQTSNETGQRGLAAPRVPFSSVSQRQAAALSLMNNGRLVSRRLWNTSVFFFCAVDTNLIEFLPRARRHPSNALQPIAWTPISSPKGSKFSPEAVIMSPSCCSQSFGEGSLYVKVLWSVSADLFLPYAHFAFPLGKSMRYNLPE